MSHFNLKSLTFYGVAIGSVVILFKVVTAYGETLKAPSVIGGVYPLKIENSPECLKSDSLELVIQQSGIYLNGVLLKNKTIESLEALGDEQLSLSGNWQDGQLSLSGSVADLNTCSPEVVNINASFLENALEGQIQFNSMGEAIAFKAEREELKQKSESHH
jgi:hypothetical protein